MPVSGYGGGYTPNKRRRNKRKGARLTNGRVIGLPGAQGPVSTTGNTFKPVGAQGGSSPTVPTQPLDPDVVNAEVTANRDVGLGDLYANFQQGNLDQDYGFGAGGAANPYSRAKLLEENFKRAKLGTTNSYAAQGQLYSGAYGRMQNENQRNYDIDYDQLRRDYDRQTGEIQFGRLQNYADAGSFVDESKWAALTKLLGGL